MVFFWLGDKSETPKDGVITGLTPPPANSATPVIVDGPNGEVGVLAAGPLDAKPNVEPASTEGLSAYEDATGEYIVWDTTGSVPQTILSDIAARVSAVTSVSIAADDDDAGKGVDGSPASPVSAQFSQDLAGVALAVLTGTGKHLVAVLPPEDGSTAWSVIAATGEYTMTAQQPDHAAASAHAASFVASQPEPDGFILIDQPTAEGE